MKKLKPNDVRPSRVVFTITFGLDLDLATESPRAKPEGWHNDIKKALFFACREHRRPTVSIDKTLVRPG